VAFMQFCVKFFTEETAQPDASLAEIAGRYGM
jgi:hypothetical protein